MTFSPATRFAAFCLLLALPMACGGGGAGSQPDLPPAFDISYVDTYVAPDTSEPEPVQDRIPMQYSREIFLLHDTAQPQFMKTGEAFVIHAKVIDYATSAPAPNALVTYSVIKVTTLADEVAEGDGKMMVEASYTNDGGVADAAFSGGTVPDLLYEILVTTDGAEPKTIRFSVAEAPCGCLEVSVMNETGLPDATLKKVKVHVLPDAYTCDMLFPEKELPPTLYDMTLTDIYDSKKFECLPADSYYSLFATSGGLSNCVVGYGCNDSTFIQPNKCKKAALKLYVVTLNPTGMYESIDHFDFTNLVKTCAGGDLSIINCSMSAGSDVGKQICCVLKDLIDVFNKPGTVIMELVFDIVKQVGGIWGTLADLALGWLKDAVGKVLTNWLLNNSPQWLQDFFKVGQDMMGIVTNLELISDLMISKLGTDWRVQGTHYWKGIALYWKIGCNPSDPDYDQCGRFEFNMDDLKNTDFPLDLVEGKFTAQIADFDNLIIDTHKIKLNYGKLVLFVLNEMIIAKLTKGKCPNTPDGTCHNVKDLAHSWIDCQKVADNLFGEIANWFVEMFGGDLQDTIDLCNGTIDFLMTPIDMFIGALALDTELSLSGSGTLVDEDCDLRVDRITGGKYTGVVEGGTGQGAGFTGKFEAKKK